MYHYIQFSFNWPSLL